MNILFLTQVFEVGIDPGSDRDLYFCKYAVSKGHHVTVITSNVDYKNAKVKITEAKGTISRSIEGIDIYYLYSYANFRGSIIKRFYYYLTFFFPAIAQSFKLRNLDVIYALSTPLTVGLMGYIISCLKGIPFVFEVSDVWPDAAVACGVVRNKTLIKLAHWLEMFCYDKAFHIVTLAGTARANIIAKGINSSKISVITNGIDSSLFNLDGGDSKRLAIRKSFGFDDHFVAMYMGAHGAYNALDTIIDAAIRLKDDTRFLFVFVGDGDAKPKLQKRVSDHRLNNIIFLPPMPRDESPVMLSAADAFVLPNRKGDFFRGNLPNKLFDFMASARPIVVSGAGETPELIMAAGCGRIGMTEDSMAMANSLIELAEMPVPVRIDMGNRGRHYVLEHYNRNNLSERWLEILADSAKL